MVKRALESLDNNPHHHALSATAAWVAGPTVAPAAHVQLGATKRARPSPQDGNGMHHDMMCCGEPAAAPATGFSLTGVVVAVVPQHQHLEQHQQHCGHQALHQAAHSLPGDFGHAPGSVLAPAQAVQGPYGQAVAPHPAAPGGPEVQQFLQRLTRSTHSFLDSCAQHGSTSLVGSVHAAEASFSEAMWHCFAELNLLMDGHFNALPTSALRGYHSFTKAPRAQLWARFAASQGGQDGDHAFGRGSGPLHVQLVLFLLERALYCYPDLQIIKYSVAVPPWMHAWCSRWGPGRDGQLHMYALHAYTPCGTQTRVLYVPEFGV